MQGNPGIQGDPGAPGAMGPPGTGIRWVDATGAEVKVIGFDFGQRTVLVQDATNTSWVVKLYTGLLEIQFIGIVIYENQNCTGASHLIPWDLGADVAQQLPNGDYVRIADGASPLPGTHVYLSREAFGQGCVNMPGGMPVIAQPGTVMDLADVIAVTPPTEPVFVPYLRRLAQ